MGDLKVIGKAKELSELIFEVTNSSPKKFRYNIVARLHQAALGIVSDLYAANDIYVENRVTTKLKKRISQLESEHYFATTAERLYDDAKLTLAKFALERTMAERAEKRLSYSRDALLKLREIDWLVSLAARTQCITRKQQERLARVIYEERALIGGFIRSERKRFGG